MTAAPETRAGAEAPEDFAPDDRRCSSAPAEPELRISAKNFARLSKFVTSELGIRMPSSKQPMLQSRLMRRVRDLGLSSLDEYCEFLLSSDSAADERVPFIDAITTNKTDFFREPRHFRFLVETALPRLAALGRTGRLQLWSAACSSGEEAYTMAMVLSEYASGRSPLDFRILATDVSTKVLRTAREGIYPRHLTDCVPPEFRRKYLLQSRSDPGLVRVSAWVRRTVSFHRLNLMDEEYGIRETFDVIFCRNVLIYFDRPTQQAVIGKLCRNLRRGGYLLVSHSESLSGLDLPLVSLGDSCYRRTG